MIQNAGNSIPRKAEKCVNSWCPSTGFLKVSNEFANAANDGHLVVKIIHQGMHKSLNILRRL